MRSTTKLLVAVLAVLAVGASTGFAQAWQQLEQTNWAGRGEGECDAPGIWYLFPWEEWGGQIINCTFRGEWTDASGNLGSFNGMLVSSDDDKAVYEGDWTFFDGFVYQPGGTFTMTFYVKEMACKGEWDSGYPTYGNREMHGYKL